MTTMTTPRATPIYSRSRARRSSTRAAAPARARSSRRRRPWTPSRSAQTIEIWSSDPATKNDIGAWSAKVGHTSSAVPGEGYERTSWCARSSDHAPRPAERRPPKEQPAR